MNASVLKRTLYSVVTYIVFNAAVLFNPLYSTVSNPNKLYASVAEQTIEVSTDGILVDAATGAFLYDALTGRPLMA